MVRLDKLMGIVAIGQSLTSATALENFLSQLARVMALAVTVAMMASLFLAGLLGALYLFMIQQGVGVWAAIAATGVALFVAAGVAVIFMKIHLKRLRYMPHRLTPNTFFAFSRRLKKSFVQGFRASSHRR